MLTGPRMGSATRWSLVVAAVVVTAGCTTTTAGSVSPTAEPPTSAPSSTASAAPSSTSGSGRPRSIDMAGVDPCSLISAEQAAALAPDMRRVRKTDPYSTDPGCLLASNSTVPVYTIVESTQPIATFEGTNENRVSRPTTVVGFPAVAVYRPTDLKGCFVVVDVADGKSLMAQQDDRTGTPIEQICSVAENLANTAMTSLLAQR